jgi:hypothetical protein
MTSSTVDHADYVATPGVTTADPQLTLADLSEANEQRARAVSEARTALHPDPTARSRYARLLYAITGWEVFGGDERGYVSRLWAEDWESPEDSAYDEP